MRIAFVMQTYSGSGLDQIERLVSTLARGLPERTTIVGHRGSDDEIRRLRAHEAIDGVLPAPGGRGGFGMLDGLFSCMRWLEKQPRTYDWLVIASPSDYPVRPLSEFAAELAASNYDGFFRHFDAADAAAAAAPPMNWTPELVRDRYLFQYAMLKEEVSTLERAILKLPRLALERTRSLRLHTSFSIMLGTAPAKLPFDQAFRLYGGNHWMVINRKAAATVLEFIDSRPDIVDYFRQVIAPQEALIPSILANDPGIRLSPRELRYIEFGGRHGHATEFRMHDLDRIFATDCYLARRFSLARSPEVFEYLDARIFANDRQPAPARSLPAVA